MSSKLEHIEHSLKPIYDQRSQVLVLGTMPSPKSREVGFYYGHPRNRFWPVLARLFDEPLPETNDDRTDFLLRHSIALWDVLKSCDISGASDASIAHPKPNDLSTILKTSPIKAVFCTGGTAEQLYRKLCEPATAIPAQKLPSPSPANAAWSMNKLVEAYQPLKEAITPFMPPVLDVKAVGALEQTIAKSGTSLKTLMRRAGRFLGYEVQKLLKSDSLSSLKDHPVVIFCGNGNNGGDGWVAGEYLDAQGITVTIVTAKAPEDLRAEPARTAALEAKAALSNRSGVIIDPDDETLSELIYQSSLIIDAILGTGFAHDSVRPPFDRWIRAINNRPNRKIWVVAADVPSGLSAQTGTAAKDSVRANLTVTMIVSKPGLTTDNSKPYRGNLKVAPLSYIEPFL